MTHDIGLMRNCEGNTYAADAAKVSCRLARVKKVSPRANIIVEANKIPIEIALILLAFDSSYWAPT